VQRIEQRLIFQISAFLLSCMIILASIPARAQSDELPIFNSDWSVLLFGGKMSRNAFGRTLGPFNERRHMNIFLAGAAASRKLYKGDYFDIEAEAGVGYQFSKSLPGNDSPQVWGALYLRYKYFPWNKFVYTTVAVNTGLNYSFKKTAFEAFEGRADGTKNLLHYLAPEITFSLPSRRDWEMVFRLHHRSGIYGLLGCSSCGTNVVTLGIRKHF